MKFTTAIISTLVLILSFVQPSSAYQSITGGSTAPTYTTSEVKTGSKYASMTLGDLTSPPGDQLQAALQKSIIDCNEGSKNADIWCGPSNPKIQDAMAGVGIVLNGISAMKSMNDACTEYGKAMKIAQVGLTAYNVTCTSFKYMCESTCKRTQQEIDRAVETLKIDKAAYESAAAIAKSTGNWQGIEHNERMATAVGVDIGVLQKSRIEGGAVLNVCERYSLNLAAAGAGLLNVVRQASVSQSCEKATKASGAGVAVDCTKPENDKAPDCMCMRAPNTPGCAGYTGNDAMAAYPGGGAGATPNSDNLPPPMMGLDGKPSPSGGGSMGGGGGSGMGSMGGGSGSLGGDGGAGAGAKSADGKREKGLNPNILSGYDGGGGGGAGGFRGGSAPGSSAYNAYLPGGAKDPNRGIASKTYGNGEITGAGSKSNWEKVRERYLDSKPTLMGP